MELPKNITQIGESDRSCKVYVEDYVVSYIKQINQLACNKDMAVALYGTRKVENNISYLFIYGACKLDFLQRETRHLSQAQQQEIEKLRRKYFPEQEFQGYRLLNGEMVEGFHICEQDICRYIMGYAQFYEKNDGMLAYMLDTRATEVEPEVVSREKYDTVRKRQEERRGEYYRDGYRREEAGIDYKAVEAERAGERKSERERGSVPNISSGMKRMRVSTVAVFGILCVAGLAMLWDGQNTEDLQVAARQAVTDLTEQKLPDALEVMNAEAEVSTLIAEDKLSEAVLAENGEQGEVDLQEAQTEMITSEMVVEANPVTSQFPVVKSGVEAEEVVATVPTPEPTVAPTPAPEPTPMPTPTATPKAASGGATASYIIQKGDTLIDICIRQYGTENMVQEVCALNDICDPDDIKVGEKILLP